MESLQDIMEKPDLKEEDKFAMGVTGGLHLVLILFFILYTFSIDHNPRPSFLEVEFGEFQSGSPAEFAEQTNEEVATRPDPSETEPEDPQPVEPDPVEEQEATTDEPVKPVDAPDQEEEVISEDVIEMPDTDIIDPEALTSDEVTEEVVVPPKTEEDEDRQDGEETSGDIDGTEGDVNADQGTGNEQEKSSPYELEWEGDIDRSPMVQPMPTNTADIEATITIRFEVKADGTIGNAIPIRKMSPELEREVMQTLRSWRFSRLPSGVPQQSQWGTITFRFVLE